MEQYEPKTAEEKLMLLVGRVQAFAGYVNSTEYSIDKKVAAEMLGFELKEGKCKGEGND